MRPSLSTAEVAARLGTTQNHVRKLAHERKLPHYRIGGSFKFDPAEIDAYLERVHVAADGREPERAAS